MALSRLIGVLDMATRTSALETGLAQLAGQKGEFRSSPLLF